MPDIVPVNLIRFLLSNSFLEMRFVFSECVSSFNKLQKPTLSFKKKCFLSCQCQSLNSTLYSLLSCMSLNFFSDSYSPLGYRYSKSLPHLYTVYYVFQVNQICPFCLSFFSLFFWCIFSELNRSHLNVQINYIYVYIFVCVHMKMYKDSFISMCICINA